MNRPLNTGKLNSLVTVNKYTFTQDASGGNEKALIDTYDLWSQLEPLNGSRILDNLGLTYTKAYKMTSRYELSRPMFNTNEVVYDGFVYVIQSVTQLEEGRRNFNVSIIYTTGTAASEEEPVGTCAWEEIEW